MNALTWLFSMILNSLGIGLLSGISLLSTTMSAGLVKRKFGVPIGKKLYVFFMAVKGMYQSIVGTGINEAEYAEA